MGQTSTVARSATNQQRLRLTEKEWKAWAKQGDARAAAASMKSGNTLLVKAGVFGVEKAEGGGEDSPIIMRISSASPDRHSDTVALDGWRTDNYIANGVVLFAHDDRDLPVGKNQKLYSESGFLKSAWVPTRRDVYEFGWTVGQLVREGFLNAASVGFIPLAYQWNEERGDYAVDFTEQELLEWSVVPVPANPDCLVEAKSMGLPVHLIGEWCAETLEGLHLKGQLTPELRVRVERTWKAASPRPTYFLMGKSAGTVSPAERRALSEKVGGEVVVLPAGVALARLEDDGTVKHLVGGARRKDDDGEEGEPDGDEPGVPMHTTGSRVSCSRLGMEGKVGTVQEMKDGPCYAVLFDGDASPTSYLLGEELSKAEEAQPTDEGKSTKPDMKKAAELAAEKVREQLRMWQTGRLPDNLDNV